MWIFTETGFVSAVRKHDAPTKVTVRARDRRSLLELSELAETEIVETPHADYRFRVLVDDMRGSRRTRGQNERVIIAPTCPDVNELLGPRSVKCAHRTRRQRQTEPIGDSLVRSESRRGSPGEDGADHAIGNATGSSWARNWVQRTASDSSPIIAA